MRIKFERMNFDAECAYDLINERGFLISELPYSDIDKTIRNLDGPRSPRYGTQYEDANAYVERFRCACGQYVHYTFIDYNPHYRKRYWRTSLPLTI